MAWDLGNVCNNVSGVTFKRPYSVKVGVSFISTKLQLVVVPHRSVLGPLSLLKYVDSIFNL